MLVFIEISVSGKEIQRIAQHLLLTAMSLFTTLVANASPFSNTSAGGELPDVRSWLFLLISSTSDVITKSPIQTSGASVGHEDPSAEPSPQTAAGNAVSPWQDDKFNSAERATGGGNTSAVTAINPGSSLADALSSRQEPTKSKSSPLSVPKAVNQKHEQSKRSVASPNPSQQSRTSKHSDHHSNRQRGEITSSPHGATHHHNNASNVQEDNDNNASYNLTMDSTAQSSSSYVLSKRAIAAQKSRDATLREKEFWANRLRLLRREMEQVEQSVAEANESALRKGAAQVEDAIRQQLQDEQAREAKTRAERLEANRIQREAHNRSVREAQQASLTSKRSQCQARRQESVEAAVFVEEQQSRELHRRSLLKEAVQQEKVVQVLVRARTRALRMEETRRLYEQRIHLLQDEDEQLQQATANLIHESSRYVQKMRLLKEERSNALLQ